MSDYSPDLCLYHANCDDGLTAAWAIWNRWPECEFRAAQYGNPPPEDVADKNVLIVDFSWPAEQLELIAETARTVLVLDHHKTAQSALSGLNQITRPDHQNIMRYFARMSGGPRSRILVEFDMERSGARMAWSFAFPGEKPPMLVKLVEDRDLWRFRFPETKPVRMFLQTIGRDFCDWHTAFALIESNLDFVLTVGSAIQRFYDARVQEMADSAIVRAFEGFDGVPVAHVPYAFVSDVCHQLLAKHPDAPFAAACVIAHGGVTYSLRSSDDRADVSAIAKARGGGGHRNAAGFRLEEQGGAA